MESVAIITARGGSKRIPEKNIRQFCGKPIIAYSIQAALESGIFDEVMVSTDSDKIAQIAENYGASVPFMRSEKTSNDFAGTNDVLLEVLDEYEKRNMNFVYACCIYPTAPFVTGEKLKGAMQKLKEMRADAVIPIAAFSYPPQRGMVLNGDYAELKWDKYMDSRSQDLEKIYHDCGQYYAFLVESFKQNKKLMSGKIAPMIYSELEVQDIDSMEDWHLAELKYQYMKENKNDI